MTVERQRGFTLLELLLTATLASLVATSAVAALGLFADANERTITSAELAIDVDRTLQRFRRDVERATSITLSAQQWTFAQADGSSVVWARPASDTELHRFAGNDLAALLASAQAIVTAVIAAPQYDARGRLRDASYRPSAMVQGNLTFQASAVTSPFDGAPIGVRLVLGHPGAAGPATQTCTACSLALVEKHCKP